jgi:hypothetical protein
MAPPSRGTTLKVVGVHPYVSRITFGDTFAVEKIGSRWPGLAF